MRFLAGAGLYWDGKHKRALNISVSASICYILPLCESSTAVPLMSLYMIYLIHTALVPFLAFDGMTVTGRDPVGPTSVPFNILLDDHSVHSTCN